MRRALAECGAEATVVLDAQSHLRGWYERLGFTATGTRPAALVFDGAPVAAVDMALTADRWAGLGSAGGEE